MSVAYHIALTVLVTAGLLMTGCNNKSESNSVEYTKPDGSQTVDIKSISDGEVPYRVLGGGNVPAEAEKLHREARARGEAGDYASALALLRQASEVAPEWAYPRYDMAFTYLLQGDATNALLHYREVERLEPRGFFTTKTALWTLDREESGIFPKGTYLAFVLLEWADSECEHRSETGLISPV